MGNGKFIRRIGKDSRRCLSGLLLIILILVSLQGCRSVCKVAEETGREELHSFGESLQADTLRAAATSREEKRDSAELRADEHTVISLARDSAGRIVGITAKSRKDYRGVKESHTEGQRWFDGLNATRSSEASGTVAAVAQKKEETNKKAEGAKYVSRLVGISLLLILCAYIIDIIYMRWKKRK